MSTRYQVLSATMMAAFVIAGAGCTTTPTLDVSSSGPAPGTSPRFVIAQRAASPSAEPYPYFVFCDPERCCSQPTGQTEIRHERANVAETDASRGGTEEPEHSNIRSGADAAPLYTARFAFDRATLAEPDQAGLERFAVEVLSAPQSLPLRVRGYTDDVGGSRYNQRLALRRAEAVRDYLIAHGLDAATLTLEGFGRCCYVASNQTARGRAANRRAEVLRSVANQRGAAPSE